MSWVNGHCDGRACVCGPHYSCEAEGPDVVIGLRIFYIVIERLRLGNA